VKDLVIGTYYRAVVRAVNKHGESEDSVALDGTFANVPDAPNAPETVNVDNMIHIKWQEPASNNGAVVDVYHIMVLQHYEEKYTRVEECNW
jgi:hypothetical protein